jgi:glycosyltransferase involved in cell wall biosynthesis
VSRTIDGINAEVKLRQRLLEVSRVLLDDRELDGHPDTGQLLDSLVRAVGRDLTPEHMWLLYISVWATYPTIEDVLEGLRVFELGTPTDGTLWLLDHAPAGASARAADHEIEVVLDKVVVDVDQAARDDLHTGIQEVVRRTLPVWERDKPILAVAWSPEAPGWRRLTAAEHDRVFRWDSRSGEPVRYDVPKVVVVPWRTVAVLPEVPGIVASDYLAGVARFSGNRVVAVGHDCVPVLSADLMPEEEPGRFARYLSVVKYMQRVAAVSNSAAAEFRGFASALASQGLVGPEVVTCLNGFRKTSAGESNEMQRAPSSRRENIVLCVGSLEPRKNHLALLFAAEMLWREGHDFEVALIAGSGWGDEATDRVEELKAAGRAITVRHRVSSAELVRAYRNARFTVLPSLHEGFGLPVAESLAAGTPVVTSCYGGTAEVAAGGGCIVVDPYDDDALVDAMRELLTDDGRLEALRKAALSRLDRSWEESSSELWDSLVAPELAGQARYKK